MICKNCSISFIKIPFGKTFHTEKVKEKDWYEIKYYYAGELIRHIRKNYFLTMHFKNGKQYKCVQKIIHKKKKIFPCELDLAIYDEQSLFELRIVFRKSGGGTIKVQKEESLLDWDYFDFLGKKVGEFRILSGVSYMALCVGGVVQGNISYWKEDGSLYQISNVQKKKSVLWGIEKNEVLKDEYDQQNCAHCEKNLGDYNHSICCGHIVCNDCVKKLSYYCKICDFRVFDHYVSGRIIKMEEYKDIQQTLKTTTGLHRDICDDLIQKKYGCLYSYCAHKVLCLCRKLQFINCECKIIASF